jgi:putative sigma-54 modulation protein
MSQMVVKGKNIEISEPLHSYVEKKLSKLDRHFDGITAMTVELSAEPRKSSNNGQVVQVTMQVNGQILRAEEASADMFMAVDSVVEKLERSIERYKSKLHRKDDIRKSRREEARNVEMAPVMTDAEISEDTGITHTKHFPIKPMSPREATEQMELLGHDFYLFYNEDTTNVSVVYKRRNGTYGLLIPEME